MITKIGVFICSLLLLFNLCGCVVLLAGAATGAGTATWLGGKLTQEFNASFDESFKATKSALKSLRLEITKETTKDDIIQIIGSYTDERTIWVDIRPISDKTSRIDVRVGAAGDKEAARKILDRIKRYL